MVTNAPAAWGTLASLPVPVAEVGVGQLHSCLHVIGGTSEPKGGEPTSVSAYNMAFDPSTNRWAQRAPLPKAASHVGVTELDGKLYAIGGLSDNVHLGPHREAFVYDPIKDDWAEIAPLPSARGSIAVAAVAGRVHALGGHDSSKVLEMSPPGGPLLRVGIGTVKTHDVYDPARGEWSAGAPLPGPPRDHMGIAVLDGRIHVFGGRVNDYSDMLDRHDVYDPTAQRWTVAAPLPRPRSAGAFVVLDGLIVYAGGECKPGGEPFTANAFDDVTAYDPENGTWLALPPLPGARHAFGGATIGKLAYFAGGSLLCGGGKTTDELLTLSLGTS